MPPLAQTELHKLIGTSTTWTDTLWHDAITYVHAQDDYTRMSMVRALVGLPWERGTTLNDCLEDFHRLPPTTMLGLYDRARWEQVTDAYRDR